MYTHFQPGDRKTITVTVSKDDTAAFATEEVHPVYATFALARDVEWACRQFALDMKEPDEEGIGTMLHIEHLAPALVGQEIRITAIIESIEGTRIRCRFEALAGTRLIARGLQDQRILKKTELNQLFDSLKS